jgi:hypothetical protein
MSEAAMAFLCLVLTAFFFHSAVFPRTKTFLCDYDNTYQYYPWMHKVASDWRALTPPLWDFSVAAGLPFPGELQTAAFYPINILYVWLTGIPTPGKLDVLIDPTDGFMSVTVPAGTSAVQWSYWPWWLVPEMVCWLLGAVILAAFSLLRKAA